jgi:hypothetical protein
VIGLLPGMWCILCALVAQMCADDWMAMLACATLTTLNCFLSPYPKHASGSRLILQRVSDPLAAGHVVYVVCPCCSDACCWLAMMACAPLTSLLDYLSPNTTHASGSLLFPAGSE